MNSDPLYFGPGVWFTIHHGAARARTLENIKQYIIWVLNIILELPCSDCSGHAKEFVLRHNPWEYRNITDDENGQQVGMFYWSWLLHNYANKNSGKEEITYKKSCKIWKSILEKSTYTITYENSSSLDMNSYAQRKILESGYELISTVPTPIVNTKRTVINQPIRAERNNTPKCSTCALKK